MTKKCPCDGNSFLHYNTEEGLIHNAVSSILEDSRGHLWFGTGEAVTCYDGERFIHYSTELGFGANDYLPKPFQKEELLTRINIQVVFDGLLSSISEESQ